MSKKLLKRFGIPSVVLLFALSGSAQARKLYGECYDCNANQTEAVAKNIGLRHLHQSSILRIHVADIPRLQISSFKMLDRDGKVTMSRISTPSTVKQYMDGLVSANASFKQVAQQIVIPVNVVRDAWEYVNCAYCENKIRNYAGSTLAAEALVVKQSISALATAFGLVQTGFVNQYSMPLAGGGEVIVELGVSKLDTLTLKVVKVIDENDNTIPPTPNGLKDLKIIIETNQDAARINTFINQFNFRVPPGVTGVVKITDCPTAGCNVSDP